MGPPRYRLFERTQVGSLVNYTSVLVSILTSLKLDGLTANTSALNLNVEANNWH